MSPSTNERIRISLVGGLLVFGFVAAVVGQARVQLWGRNDVLEKARKSRRFFVEQQLPALRGTIYTADKKAIAEDWDSGELRLNTDKVPLSSAFFMDLGLATGIPPSEIAAQCSAKRGSQLPGVVWKRPISPGQVAAVEDVRVRWRADGVSVARGGQRTYGLGAYASGILGRVADGKGVSGLELGLEKELGGKPGFRSGVIDRNGMFLPTKGESELREAAHGVPVVLTIDSVLQRAAGVAVRKAVEKEDADNGVAIVVDPSTGDILAMANWPSYDPDATFRQPVGTNKPSSDLNPAYMSILEPGSTFKVLTLAEGFDRGVVSPGSTLYCGGTLGVGRRTISCDYHGGTRAHGSVDPEMAIAKSCNVSAATWALRIGYTDYVSYLEKLGLLEKPDLGFPTEAAGLFRRDEPAKKLQLATLGFGQSIGCVPIALAGAFSMLGNEGVRMKLRLVKQIGNREIPPKEAARVVSSEAANRTLKIMESVFEKPQGTGAKLRIKGYVLAGKTGTAEKIGRNTSGYVSNFVGFVPARDPQALVLVMVNNPRKAYYGAAVAGPVFVEIAKAVLDRYGIPPTGEGNGIPVTTTVAEGRPNRS